MVCYIKDFLSIFLFYYLSASSFVGVYVVHFDPPPQIFKFIFPPA